MQNNMYAVSLAQPSAIGFPYSDTSPRAVHVQQLLLMWLLAVPVTSWGKSMFGIDKALPVIEASGEQALQFSSPHSQQTSGTATRGRGRLKKEEKARPLGQWHYRKAIDGVRGENRGAMGRMQSEARKERTKPSLCSSGLINIKGLQVSQ